MPETNVHIVEYVASPGGIGKFRVQPRSAARILAATGECI
jgi:hypothetical protein